ncbi:Rv3235 family protein [Cellulomonas fimi]|uniref:Rv3235 family protein n=1 Tax=Cellulomonas fimi TaxID=1708 RepID=UPI00234D0B9E|nr:Rv3235 family protein [Cellulomonas fimi]MDC7121135.1 Rv3235 family protein [Cellulomonas fimi]
MSAALRDATAAERVFVRSEADSTTAGARPTTRSRSGHGTGHTSPRTGRTAGASAVDESVRVGLAGVGPAATTLDAGVTARTAGPRARLVRAAEPAAPVRATGPQHAVAPTIGHRLDVLRAQDRSPVLDAADEDRGAVPAHDPGVLAGRIALATVEVLGGRRPIGQLARWLTPGVLDALQVRAALTLRVRGTSSRAPQVRRVRASAVDEHTLEAGVVVEDGSVVRAVALRLETHRGAWRATVLEIG